MHFSETSVNLELKDDKLSPTEKLGNIKLNLLLTPKYAEEKALAVSFETFLKNY